MPAEGMLVHDYFFAKSLDHVRPGGLVAFITASGTLDKKSSSASASGGQGRAGLRGEAADSTFQGVGGDDRDRATSSC